MSKTPFIFFALNALFCALNVSFRNWGAAAFNAFAAFGMLPFILLELKRR